MPSQQEIQDNGMDIGEFNALLLLKIEELTLYVIEQNQQIKSLQHQIEILNQ